LPRDQLPGSIRGDGQSAIPPVDHSVSNPSPAENSGAVRETVMIL
jgi:hypothetical protein